MRCTTSVASTAETCRPSRRQSIVCVPDASPIVDAWGQPHQRAAAGVRIVSLVPSITELLFALNLGPQVVGRTTFCVHPHDAVRHLQEVGGTKNVKLDRVRDLAPTHVIVNIDENTRETFDGLKAFVPNVVVTHPNSPDDNIGLYRLLGAIFGREAAAEQLVGRFERALAQLTRSVIGIPHRRVLYLIWRQPWMTVSPETYIAQMLGLAGWTTVPRETDTRYPRLEEAQLRTLDIDLCLLSSEPYPFRDVHLHEVRALARGAQVELVNGEMLSWYGSRAISGLAYLARLARRTAGVSVPACAASPADV